MRRIKVWAVAVVYALALNWCIACSSSTERSGDRYANTSMREVIHINGLKLRVADSLLVEQTASGFLVRTPETIDTRAANEVRVSLHTGVRQPDGNEFNEHRINNRTVYYHVMSDTVGSGGTEFWLDAWEVRSGGYISYEHSRQGGGATEPDYDLCWHVIEGTSVRQQN